MDFSRVAMINTPEIAPLRIMGISAALNICNWRRTLIRLYGSEFKAVSFADENASCQEWLEVAYGNGYQFR